MEHRRIVDSHSLAIKLYLHIHIENFIRYPSYQDHNFWGSY